MTSLLAKVILICFKRTPQKQRKPLFLLKERLSD